MKTYSFLQLLGWLYRIGGVLLLLGGILWTLSGCAQVLQPYNTAGWGTLLNGVLLIAVALVSLGLAELISLLFEIRARLAGTYVERAPTPKTPATTPARADIDSPTTPA